MDRSECISLIRSDKFQDDYGVWRSTETRTDVFCQVNSVTQREFFEGGRNGLNPEYVFTVFFADYDDQPIIEYRGLRYSVYRTYRRRDDTIELYVQRKGGSNQSVSA